MNRFMAIVIGGATGFHLAVCLSWIVEGERRNAAFAAVQALTFGALSVAYAMQVQ